ncbi:hypothetical protein DM01DRAFT_1030406 [Hesseltinella vesiculosa]|uniref:Uncharacterized protein n=1 Tax=Hesseltinella vesiculosa TaxID=101127 RepID=A0A1X2GJ80_9FUNG|nr:hypothetical protein DM01DRAFT_1030406 [Hesseltinella vesiculosa]
MASDSDFDDDFMMDTDDIMDDSQSGFSSSLSVSGKKWQKLHDDRWLERPWAKLEKNNMPITAALFDGAFILKLFIFFAGVKVYRLGNGVNVKKGRRKGGRKG